MTKYEWSEPDWRLNVEGMTNDQARIALRSAVGASSLIRHSSRVIRRSSFS